tara:strand:- start:400 stop:1269 length:870 start_codon:yes stop_codon:yes gene_type:complete
VKRLLLTLLLLVGCKSDISIHEQREVRVVVDSFVQPDKLGELDVLIALDTSGSMMDNYENVAEGMEILRTDIEHLTLDYQFGYITMDPNETSYLGPYDSYATTIDMLMAPSLLPTTRLEEGFSATYTFLQSEDGQIFRRPEADFLLFLVSDEDEQSGISSGLFYDWMHDEFKDVNHDVVCIANPDDENGGWANEVGYKYIELSHMYNKSMIDIKAEDWSVWLSNSSYLTSLESSLDLSESEPIIESIIVYVNQEKTVDWYYISEKNMVQLMFTPDYGAIIEVGYNVYAQ